GQQRELHARRGEERPGDPAALRPRGGGAGDQELHEPARRLLRAGAAPGRAARGAGSARIARIAAIAGIAGIARINWSAGALCVDTLYGPREVDALLRKIGQVVDGLVREAAARGLGAESSRRLVQSVTDAIFAHSPAPFSLDAAERALFDAALDRDAVIRDLYA